MKKLNVGLVGAGFMGKAHSIGYSDMPKYFWPAPAVPVLKTICDIVPEIAADAKERFGFEKCCTDWRDIVNDPEIDVVSICTPNNVHAEIAIAALNAGKHVLCEKPIASTLEDAKAMAEAAKKAAQKGIIAMNAYQYRRVPAIDLAKNSSMRDPSAKSSTCGAPICKAGRPILPPRSPGGFRKTSPARERLATSPHT